MRNYIFTQHKYGKVFISLLVLLSLSYSSIFAGDKKNPPNISGTPISWQDGKVTRTLLILPDMVLEFTPASGDTVVKSVDSSAKTVMETRSFRIHKISDPILKSSLGKGIIPDVMKKSGNFIPVFSENGSETNLFIPIGNIIVELEKGYLEKNSVDSWARSNSIKIIRKLNFSTRNFYLIESAPGMPALELANQLLKKEGVVSAKPEFWINSGLR